MWQVLQIRRLGRSDRQCLRGGVHVRVQHQTLLLLVVCARCPAWAQRITGTLAVSASFLLRGRETAMVQPRPAALRGPQQGCRRGACGRLLRTCTHAATCWGQHTTCTYKGTVRQGWAAVAGSTAAGRPAAREQPSLQPLLVEPLVKTDIEAGLWAPKAAGYFEGPRKARR